MSLLDHASDVITLLEKFSIVREDEMLGTLDTSVLAHSLKKLWAAFNASLDEVSGEEQKLVGALNTRDTELVASRCLPKAHTASLASWPTCQSAMTSAQRSAALNPLRAQPMEKKTPGSMRKTRQQKDSRRARPDLTPTSPPTTLSPTSTT